MLILLQGGPKKKKNFKTLKDFAKLNCLPLAMQAHQPWAQKCSSAPEERRALPLTTAPSTKDIVRI